MKRISYIIAAAAMLSACNLEKTLEEGNGGLMTIDFTTADMVATRGKLVSGSIGSYIDTVKLYIYNGDTPATGAPQGAKYKSSSWTVSDYYWKPGVALDFYAVAAKNLASYSIASITNSIHKLEFNYSIPVGTTPGNMPDLMVTHATKTATASDTKVSLTLKHALTAIQFKTGNSVAPMKIGSLAISKIKNSGSCTYTDGGSPEFNWGTPTGDQSFTYTPKDSISVSLNTSTDIVVGDSTFVLIPQTPDAFAQVTLGIRLDGQTKTTVSCALTAPSGGWLPGKKYTYTLNYKKGMLTIDGDITASVWTDETGGNLTLN